MDDKDGRFARAYKAVFDAVEPPEELLYATLQHCAQAAQAEASNKAAGCVNDSHAGAKRGSEEGGAAALMRGRGISRRAFATIGAACAGVALLGVGVGIGLGGRGRQGDNQVGANMDALLANGGSSTRAFGLSIAMASEAGTPVELALADDGFMPVADRVARSFDFKMNFACSGEGLTHVVFRLNDVPTAEVTALSDGELGTLWEEEKAWAEARGTTLANTFEDYRSIMQRSAEESSRLVWLSIWENPSSTGGGTDEEADAAVLRRTDSIPFDLTTLNGSGQSGWRDGFGWHRVLGFAATKQQWIADDPVLLASAAYTEIADQLRTQGVTIDESGACDNEEAQTQLDEARARFEEAVDEVAATDESLLAWGRSRYVWGLTRAAQNLAQATLELEAKFDDGTSATRCYRIAPVDDFEDRVAVRFDALSELPGAFDPDLARPSDPYLQTWYPGFIDADVPIDTADERLTASLFTIAEVAE